jgi:hypothetical protein
VLVVGDQEGSWSALGTQSEQSSSDRVGGQSTIIAICKLRGSSRQRGQTVRCDFHLPRGQTETSVIYSDSFTSFTSSADVSEELKSQRFPHRQLLVGRFTLH